MAPARYASDWIQTKRSEVIMIVEGWIAMTSREALEIAIEDEEKARERYRELAKQAGDPETRLLFEQLAREEDVHGKRLADKLRAIKLLG